MTYSQKANPNATNSELDSKRIITHKELTSAQRDELIDQFVELQVDNMDWKTLAVFVTEELQYRFRNDYTDEELREEIQNYDEDLYEELIDNVTNPNVNQGGQS